MSLLTFPNSGNTYYYRSRIPFDLIEHFGGLKEFRISLKCAIKSRSIRTTKILDQKVSGIFEDIRQGMKSLDIDDIKVEKKSGGSISDSSILQGIILDKEVVHSGMPKKITGAKIALINTALEISKPETDAKINISNPQQMKSFLDEESKMLEKMVDKVVGSGASVVFCQKGIDDMSQHYLSKAGILAVRRVKESDLTKLAKATGGRIITNQDDLFEKDLGVAGLVEERKIEEDRWVFVEDCKHPKSVTLLLRAGSL